MHHSSPLHVRARRAAFSTTSSSLAIKGLVLAALSAAAGAASADPSVAMDRASVAAGAFYAEPKIQIGAGTDSGYISSPNQTLDKATLPRVKANLLLGDSQGIALDYYHYDKSYGADVSGSTVNNGEQISGSGTINSKLQLDLAQAAYKWWLGQGNDVFGIGVGAGYYSVKIDGSAVGTASTTVAGITTTRPINESGSASESAVAPLLTLGWRHAFTPDLRLVADISGMKKNGGNLNGHIYNGSLGVEWFFAKNVGIEADYSIQKIQLARDSGRAADLKVRLTGPSAYLKVRF